VQFKKVLGAISRLMRPKMKLFAVETHFGSFRLMRFMKKVLGVFSQFTRPKTKAVSCEVQTHLGSFHLARYITKVLYALSRFLRPQTKLFAMKFTRILEVFSVQAL